MSTSHVTVDTEIAAAIREFRVSIEQRLTFAVGQVDVFLTGETRADCRVALTDARYMLRKAGEELDEIEHLERVRRARAARVAPASPR